MSVLLQNTAGSVVAFLQNNAGVPATGLLFSALAVDFRKAGGSFVAKTLAVSATASIGTGANGTVDLTAVPGASGNAYSIQVVVPVGTAPLTVTQLAGNITVNLAVAAGVPQNVQNTAALVADAINSVVVGVVAEATGTGVDSLTLAEGPAFFEGGVDYFTELGGGFYEFFFSATELDTLGSFVVRVVGPNLRTLVTTNTVVPVTVTSTSPLSPPDLATIFGFVHNTDGTPVVGTTVSARVLNLPLVYAGAESSALATSLVVSKTDATGFFTLSLVVGTTVQINVPVAGYKKTLTVPAAGGNLFDI